MNKPLTIVLVNPQIPQNTGTIARLVACTGLRLFLVGTLGFKLNDSNLKRAGLDYWDKLDVSIYKTWEDMEPIQPNNHMYYFSTKGTQLYSNITYQPGDYLIFGSETAGLPRDMIDKNPDNLLRIPMINDVRSLNLANTVSIVAYEALRQNGFHPLK